MEATVNGDPVDLENSVGAKDEDLCGVEAVTSRFVKFDNLPDADSYAIVFKLNHEYGNFLETTAWLKAGTSCHEYVVHGPCCPF